MSSAQRLPVVPTVTVLAVMKARLLGAVKGHALLKKKADALNMRFRLVLKRILQSKLRVGTSMRTASFALTEAKYAAGDFRYTVQDGVGAATVRVRAATDNVAGVKVPRFEVGGAAATATPAPAAAPAASSSAPAAPPRTDLTGLGAGGQQVAAARAAFLASARLLVELASLQTAFVTLDAAIKTTNRRVNALDNVVRPRLEATIDYIKGELDELEREEFFRLKKVQAKKKRDAAAAAAAKAAAGGGAVVEGATPAAVPSAVGGRDEEVVF